MSCYSLQRRGDHVSQNPQSLLSNFALATLAACGGSSGTTSVSTNAPAGGSVNKERLAAMEDKGLIPKLDHSDSLLEIYLNDAFMGNAIWPWQSWQEHSIGKVTKAMIQKGIKTAAMHAAFIHEPADPDRPMDSALNCERWQ